MFLVIFLFALLFAPHLMSVSTSDIPLTNANNTSFEYHKKTLDNGLTVLIRKTNTNQAVSVQIWYKVGSKDEEPAEGGLAHALEHMVFKGTKKLSETDIPTITHLLAGNCNASTSYDWTRYYFNFPQKYCDTALEILADCMRNCTFKQDLLNSEIKAVIEELRMRDDHHTSVLMQRLISAVFHDHPYHYPIIGHLDDLWNFSTKTLKSFYDKYYLPKNAAIIVVGDVDVEETFAKIESLFGPIKNKPTKKIKSISEHVTTESQEIFLYRDVHNAYTLLAWEIPGAKDLFSPIPGILTCLLSNTRQSRLHKDLVEEKQLVQSIQSFRLNLEEHDLFVIGFEPNNPTDNEKIIEIIQDHLSILCTEGFSKEEFEETIPYIYLDLAKNLESNHEQASILAECWLTNNLFPDVIKDYLAQLDNFEELHKSIFFFLNESCIKNPMHKAFLLPFQTEEQKEVWLRVQQELDKKESILLSKKIRTSEIERPKYAPTLTIPNITETKCLSSQKIILDNGATLYCYNNPNALYSTIDVALNPEFIKILKKPGILPLTNLYLIEGTTTYPDETFIKVCSQYGIEVFTHNGQISMNLPHTSLKKALEIMVDMNMNAQLDPQKMDRLKTHLKKDYLRSCDSISQTTGRLVIKELYKNHPFSEYLILNEECIDAITMNDLSNCYGTYLSPQNACIVIVGKIENEDIENAKTILQTWRRPSQALPDYPEIIRDDAKIITQEINNKQIGITFAGLSAKYTDAEFLPLMVANVILFDGLSSRLFKMREQTGAFYSSYGNLIDKCTHQPGIAQISAITSPYKIEEVEKLFRIFIETVADSITQEELIDAKRILQAYQSMSYGTNADIVSIFQTIHAYGLPDDFIQKNLQKIENLTLEEVQNAVRRVLNISKMHCFKVGNVSEKE